MSARERYHDARRNLYRQKREAELLCNPNSIHYHWMTARREAEAIKRAKARFAAEWYGTPDTYTMMVNNRWAAIRRRAAYMHKRRADRLHEQVVQARYAATRNGLDWRKVRVIDGKPKYDPNAEPVEPRGYA